MSLGSYTLCIYVITFVILYDSLSLLGHILSCIITFITLSDSLSLLGHMLSCIITFIILYDSLSLLGHYFHHPESILLSSRVIKSITLCHHISVLIKIFLSTKNFQLKKKYFFYYKSPTIKITLVLLSLRVNTFVTPDHHKCHTMSSYYVIALCYHP